MVPPGLGPAAVGNPMDDRIACGGTLGYAGVAAGRIRLTADRAWVTDYDKDELVGIARS